VKKHTPNEADWSDLTLDQRNDIKGKIIAALDYLAIKDAVVNWTQPDQLPHWQRIIEAPWCSRVSRDDVSRAREQAIKRAGISAPMNGIVLKAPSKRQHKEDFNQATFRVMQEVIKRTE